MRKSSQKLFMKYILVGFAILLVTLITFLFNSKEKSIQQATTSQSIVPTSTPTSGSDLSYLMIVTDPNVNIKLLDRGGSEIGESFIQEPIIDPANSENKNKPIKELYIQKPATGDYKLIVSGNTNNVYKISTYFYDINGEVSIVENVTTGDTSFTISFDKNNGKNSYIKKSN